MSTMVVRGSPHRLHSSPEDYSGLRLVLAAAASEDAAAVVGAADDKEPVVVVVAAAERVTA